MAKGPIGLIGLVLVAYGITALIFGGHGFTTHAPTGAVDGTSWLGLEVNGWSGLLFVAAGLLLLLGAPLHWAAKSMSLIVGIALVALSLIGLANGHGALGIFAANGTTELVWGAAGALLIALSLLPRVGRKSNRVDERAAPVGATPASEPAPVAGQAERLRDPERLREPERLRNPISGADRPGLTTHGAREGSPVARG